MSLGSLVIKSYVFTVDNVTRLAPAWHCCSEKDTAKGRQVLHTPILKISLNTHTSESPLEGVIAAPWLRTDQPEVTTNLTFTTALVLKMETCRIMTNTNYIMSKAHWVPRLKTHQEYTVEHQWKQIALQYQRCYLSHTRLGTDQQRCYQFHGMVPWPTRSCFTSDHTVQDVLPGTIQGEDQMVQDSDGKPSGCQVHCSQNLNCTSQQYDHSMIRAPVSIVTLKAITSIYSAQESELQLHNAVCFTDSKEYLYLIKKQFVENQVNTIRKLLSLL